MSEVLATIAEQRVVPVLRAHSPDDAVATARACARGGMRVVELTQTTPDAVGALRELREENLLPGLGTVTDPEQVVAGVDAGARFIVSYACSPDVVEAARELGVVAIPGALTPTEVLACLRARASAVKLFPARAVSPDYLRDLRVVLPELKALVTGGLRATAESMRPWFEAGAWAVGLGADLGTAESIGAAEVERRCRAALEVAAAEQPVA